MYTLPEYLQDIAHISADRIHSDELFCVETNAAITFFTNQMQESLACYTYTLVRKGWLRLVYNGHELTLHEGDIYIYSPGFQVTVLGGSNDYHASCLIADEHMTLETPTVWNMIRTAYYPVAEFGQPVVHLSPEQAERLWKRMQEVIVYLGSQHRFFDEALRSLYTLFLLDLRDMMEQTIVSHQHSERTTNLFVGFIRLLPRHFMEHHDIGFYADELNITTTHLSRIVRQLTGRTVVDYINQMLLMEAMWLLQTTTLSLDAIAERLHFANQSSFGKFFRRMKGTSPKHYRKKSDGTAG